LSIVVSQVFAGAVRPRYFEIRHALKERGAGPAATLKQPGHRLGASSRMVSGEKGNPTRNQEYALRGGPERRAFLGI
jgi:hypothetical protein